MSDKSKNSKEKPATDGVAETNPATTETTSNEVAGEKTNNAEATGAETATEKVAEEKRQDPEVAKGADLQPATPVTETATSAENAEAAQPAVNVKMRTMAASIVAIVEDRNGTNLPKLSAKDILDTITPEQKAGVTIDIHMDENDHKKGYFNFTEFGITHRIPSSGYFEFGIDYSAPAQ